MRSAPVLDSHEPTTAGASEAIPKSAGFARRAGAFLLREFLEILPPTIFFLIGFNLIVLTTNLILADYGAQVASFIIATTSALVVAKAVLVANAMPAIRRYDRAPLIRPILFKTVFYWAAVFIVRVLEHWVRYRFGGDYVFGGFLPHVVANFSWDRFIAIQLWIFVLFLVYVTASEFNRLFGHGELRRILFTYRPSELQLNRRQRIYELVRLGKLADAHSMDEFRDPATAAHGELVDILNRLAVKPRPHSTDTVDQGASSG
jgi:hypothetical protein